MSIVKWLGVFATEERAVAWFEALRWGDTPVCPHCGGTDRISVARSKRFT